MTHLYSSVTLECKNYFPLQTLEIQVSTFTLFPSSNRLQIDSRIDVTSDLSDKRSENPKDHKAEHCRTDSGRLGH